MRLPWHRQFVARLNTSAFSTFLVSFFAGSVSGAVFGLLAASLLFGVVSGPGVDLGPVFRGGPRGRPAAEPSEPLDVREVVRRAAPAVVSIVVTKDVPKLQGGGAAPAPFGFDPFGGLFGDFFGLPRSQPSAPAETEKRKVGGGTGFFVSSDGYIVTNKHVVADADAEYSVLSNDGKQYEATVVSRDSVNDLAIVKVAGAGFPTIPFGDSSRLELGTPVVAIGNALGEFRNTVSTGVVSGLARSITAGGSALGPEQLTGVIQTDAAINPGNSGGPLLDLSGQVVGINTAVAQGAQNIGFAIPVNEARQVVESVKRHGRIIRPFLGVRYVVITPDLAKEKQLPVDYGALIVRGDSQTDLAVTPGSPADKAGLQENDIILEVGGAKVTEDNPLVKIIASYSVGDRVPMRVLRRGETKSVTVTLVERQ